MTTSFRIARRAGALLAALTPALAFAHPGHDGDHGLTWDFSGGFAHPFGGWDHLLAMVAVGLWAAQLGGRARWLVPLSFVGVMTMGAVAARAMGVVPANEQAIAASVLLLGFLVATATKIPAAIAVTLVAFFAAFHGLAHGAEIPADASGLGYGAGFVLATLLLHGAGIGLGVFATRVNLDRATKAAGWLIVGAGAILLAN